LLRPIDPWRCGNGVVFNLSRPWLPQRTMGWTSGDAGEAAAAAAPTLPVNCITLLYVHQQH
jgi:hypothetical protein